MTEITIANNTSDYKCIAQLAYITWREHYTPIIGLPQVEYMLKNLQSVEAIANQVEQGYQYFIINYEKIPVGYLSFIKKENSLYLSKIYILSNYRGRKIGKTAMQFIEDIAKKMDCNTITLTVNRNNYNSISAYEKLGFTKQGTIVQDIGEGFVMDDYKMGMDI